MAILTDIQQMRSSGMSDEEILATLQARGVSPREIGEAITQSRVKEAVVGTIPETMAPTPGAPLAQEEYAPSQAIEQAQQPFQAEPAPAQYAAYPQAYSAGAEQYPQYQQYAPQPQISTDIISEIADQIISEKLSPIKTQLEKVIDIKTTVDAKIEYIDERLKRIEKTIDRLQLSVLQKVGEYVTSTEDIKHELVEMQKSFKALSVPEKSEKPKPRKEAFE